VLYLSSLRAVTESTQTSRAVRAKTFTAAIWRSALRDILQIKPIPRVVFAMDSMSLEELRSTCIRLAMQDASTLSIRQRPLKLVGEVDVTHYVHPVLIPGGAYFVTLSSSKRKLVVHPTSPPNSILSTPLVPRSKSEIRHWRMIPCSADEILVVVVCADGQKGVM
jgi:hypothetical protein